MSDRLCLRMSVDSERGIADGVFSRTVTFHTGNIPMMKKRRYCFINWSSLLISLFVLLVQVTIHFNVVYFDSNLALWRFSAWTVFSDLPHLVLRLSQKYWNLCSISCACKFRCTWVVCIVMLDILIAIWHILRKNIDNYNLSLLFMAFTTTSALSIWIPEVSYFERQWRLWEVKVSYNPGP